MGDFDKQSTKLQICFCSNICFHPFSLNVKKKPVFIDESDTGSQSKTQNQQNVSQQDQNARRQKKRYLKKESKPEVYEHRITTVVSRVYVIRTSKPTPLLQLTKTHFHRVKLVSSRKSLKVVPRLRLLQQ